MPKERGNMKKIITLLVALLTLLTLVSCSNGSSDEENIYNPHGYEIVAIEASQLPLTLPDVDAAVINGNYALEAKLNETNPAIEIEAFNWETSIKRTNYLAVKGGNEESDKTKALVAAITSEEVEKYINDTYQGAVIASFIGADGKDIASAEIPEAGDDNVIKVGATLVPHAEILKNVVADILALKGWKLEVI